MALFGEGTLCVLPVQGLRVDLESTPSKTLMDSIKSMGIISPLLVVKTEEGRFDVVGGRRRLAAAQKLGISTVPCIVFEEEMCNPSLMTITENVNRSRNKNNEFGAFWNLLNGWDRNDSVRDFAKRLCLPLRVVEEFFEVSRLPVGITIPIVKGDLPYSVGKACLRLSPANQRVIVREIEAGKRITVKRVNEIVRETRNAAGASLPEILFASDYNTRREIQRLLEKGNLSTHCREALEREIQC
jgi:ParB family chromosome partitioning protein